MPRYGELHDSPNEREKQILDFWAENEVFEASVEQNKENENWVFYEGPPTANGRPHFGHLMARVYKDLFPRYKTMRGYYVERKGGWDTHGLPVEIEVEKDLGLNSKEEIENYGVENFIQKCKESVWEYKEEWERMISRMGFWIDLDDPYITYEDDYIESLWWELKQIWEEDLLYKGHKVLPYCPRCGTGLSSHEVAQGYELTEDPSIFVKLPLAGNEDVSLLVWTTTPWTIPSNTAVAISSNFLYAKVKVGQEKLILAKALLDKVLSRDYEVLEEIEGEDLLGLEYVPPYPLLDHDKAYQVYDASFVSLEEGTGIVHLAPAFGEEDNEFGRKVGLPVKRPLDHDGEFTSEFPLAEGMFAKDADEVIVDDLESRDYLLRHETYEHEYPFCWRCDTPLLYFALDCWYINTTARKENIIANNKKIHWHPSHMRDGRFGDFLDNLKDWALSRDRYWGTPLNIWECVSCDQQFSVGSREELVDHSLQPEKAKSVEFHRPFIDEIKLECPECGEEMERVPHVLDTWFDSGSMHTAQWHYPFEGQEKFKETFPADFISEGQDQTRGWFYTLLVTATLLYDETAFKNVVVTGYGLDAEGKAMSKSRGNVIDPWEMIEEYGADAVRWYLFSTTAPWKTRRLDPEGPGEVLYKFLNTVENVYNFFSLYANIDDFEPAERRITSDLSPLDTWVLSRLHRTIEIVTDSLDDYDVVSATEAIEKYVDDLSNWYVRCSRDRFWSEESTEDKRGAYQTLYQCLDVLSRLLAPFTPFLAEEVYSNLSEGDAESVHLCDWPEPESSLVDADLEDEMQKVRKIVALGRRARNKAEIKVRQPLSIMVYESSSLSMDIRSELQELIKEELNVKEVEARQDTSDLYVPVVKPNYSKLGPDFGSKAQSIGDMLEEADDLAVTEQLETDGHYSLKIDGEEVSVRKKHMEISYEPQDSFVEASDGDLSVLIDVEIDGPLLEEGYVRELIRRIQRLRKEAGYEVTDRIRLFCSCDEEVADAVSKYEDYLKSETLSSEVILGDVPDNTDITSQEGLNGKSVRIALSK